MSRRPPRKRSASSRTVGVERARGGVGWTLTHPRCARDCAEDLDEVRDMIAAGEHDVAIDELRWLVSTCADMIEAHYLLGKLAVEADKDLALARAHFGVGYQLGVKALARAGHPAPLAALHPANRAFFDAGRGVAWCLNELGQRDKAVEVVEHLLRCDPSDPLGLRGWIDEIGAGSDPLVQLGGAQIDFQPQRHDEHDEREN